MLARPREAGHVLVVELGGSLGRDMALAAVSAELAVVRVVFLVTVDTDPLAELVPTLGMAGAAGE